MEGLLRKLFFSCLYCKGRMPPPESSQSRMLGAATALTIGLDSVSNGMA